MRIKLIWQAYKYIYYWLYTWQKRLWGGNDSPEFTAILGITLSHVFIVLSLIVLIEVFLGMRIFPEGISKPIGLFIMVIDLIIHYLVFVYKGRYKKIEQEFKSENKAQRKRHGFFVLLYAFGPMVLLILLAFLAIWLKR